jgi:hypothetical protein
VLQFVRPARSSWGLLADNRLAGMDESGGRIGLTAGTTQYHAGLYNQAHKFFHRGPNRRPPLCLSGHHVLHSSAPGKHVVGGRVGD